MVDRVAPVTYQFWWVFGIWTVLAASGTAFFGFALAVGSVLDVGVMGAFMALCWYVLLTTPYRVTLSPDRELSVSWLFVKDPLRG
jgi:hypothetical protein